MTRSNSASRARRRDARSESCRRKNTPLLVPPRSMVRDADLWALATANFSLLRRAEVLCKPLQHAPLVDDSSSAVSRREVTWTSIRSPSRRESQHEVGTRPAARQ